MDVRRGGGNFDLTLYIIYIINISSIISCVKLTFYVYVIDVCQIINNYNCQCLHPHF